MSENKAIWELVSRLESLTEQGTLVWEKTAHDDVYRVSLPADTKLGDRDSASPTSMELRKRSGQISGDEFVLKVLDHDGGVISETSDSDLSVDSALQLSPQEVNSEFKRLYTLARSKAVNVNQKLSALLETLNSL